MLLRMTYSNTKRFLKSSIQSLKSYFAGGYERLPKTPPCNPFSFSCSTTSHTLLHLNHSYREQKLQEEINTTNCNGHHTKQAAAEAATMMKGQTCSSCSHDDMKKKKNKLIIKEPIHLMMNQYGEVDIKNQENANHGIKDECLVRRKLKELEMMDENNMDLVVDIQEVLHYYSQLTCPVYRHIIDKFFVEIYSGTFNNITPTSLSNSINV